MSNQIPAEPKNTLAREMVCFIPQVMENKMRLGGRGGGEGSYIGRDKLLYPAGLSSFHQG